MAYQVLHLLSCTRRYPLLGGVPPVQCWMAYPLSGPGWLTPPPPPWTDRRTDTCQNITFPRTRSVIKTKMPDLAYRKNTNDSILEEKQKIPEQKMFATGAPTEAEMSANQIRALKSPTNDVICVHSQRGNTYFCYHIFLAKLSHFFVF